jgi:hypothetical protein
MILRFVSKYELSKAELFATSIKQAVFSIYKYPFHASELALEEYFVQHFKCGLRPICLRLLNRLKVDQPAANELVYTFRNSEDEKLARFITYGDGQNIQGSTILLDAFGITRR